MNLEKRMQNLENIITFAVTKGLYERIQIPQSSYDNLEDKNNVADGCDTGCGTCAAVNACPGQIMNYIKGIDSSQGERGTDYPLLSKTFGPFGSYNRGKQPNEKINILQAKLVYTAIFEQKMFLPELRQAGYSA